MRAAVVAGFVLVAVPAVGRGEAGPYFAAVADPEVLLRAGPGDKFPETGTLPRGTRVLVEGEDAGWLAVTAPPGSVSWVPIALVDFDPSRPVPQNVVTQAEVALAPGRVGLPQPLPDIRKAKVPEGSILTVIGQKVLFDGKQWYPVSPPPGDLRYLPKTGVRAEKPANTSFVVRDTAPPGLPPPAGAKSGDAPAGNEGSAPPGSRPDAPATSNPLWAQAEAAERDGRADEAEKLYFQLARVMNEPGGDHDIANLCYTRIHALREKKRNAALGGSLDKPKGGPVTATGPAPSRESREPREDRTPAATAPREDRPTLLPPVGTGGAAPVRAPTSPSANDTPSATDDRPRWVGPATLTRSPLNLDGRRTYALESSPGVARMYAVAAPGVDLDRYANRKIDLFGSTHTRKDLPKPYVIVTEVEVNP